MTTEATNVTGAAASYYFPKAVEMDESVIAFFGELLRGMTHKLNNSLAVIQGFSSLMAMSGGGGSKENIEHVKQASESAKF